MYSRWYQNKQHLINGTIPPLYKIIDKILSIVAKDRKVMDVGCNAGMVSFLAAKYGAKFVLGMDLGEGYIEQATKMHVDYYYDKYPSMTFLKSNVLDSIEKQYNNYDLFIFLRVLYHIRLQEDKTPEAVEEGMNILFGSIKKNKNALILAQGNPGRYKYVEDQDNFYGYKGNGLATVHGMKKLFAYHGLRSIHFGEDIILACNKDNIELLKEIVKCKESLGIQV